MSDRIEKLYSRWERSDVSEDDVHGLIDELLIKANFCLDQEGVTTHNIDEAEGIHDMRMAILDTLANLAGIESEYTGPWHITCYSVTREYGGPEEGGWYYDWFQTPSTVATVESNQVDAYHLCKLLNEAAKGDRVKMGRPQGRFSVLGGDDAVYVVEKEPGERESKERPHYE